LENKAATIKIDNADGSINVTTASTGTDINVNIKSGEAVIAKDGNNGLYTNIALSSITPSSTIVKEEYQLTATNGAKLGDSIKIYKDSHIVSITYITDSGDTHYQNLEYVYIDDSGNTQTEYVDISSLVLEAEFGSGVTVTDHVAHGVVDPTSESFFTVGADGFKVAGISAHVQSEIEKLDADVSGNSTHVTVGVEEVNGVITAVTVAEDNIANADDLAELSGKTVTAITSTNGSITASIDDAIGCKTYDIETDASKIKMSGFTTVGGDFSAITEDSSVTDAVQTVVEEVIKNEETVSAALNDLNGDITEEIEARKAVDGQSGQTYTANSGKKYISGATSLNDADVKLNDAIESITSGFISGVQLNGEDLPESDNTVNVQINASNTAASSTDAIVITQDNSTKALTLQLGTIDAGTY
jgi:hypothetical protein